MHYFPLNILKSTNFGISINLISETFKLLSLGQSYDIVHFTFAFIKCLYELHWGVMFVEHLDHLDISEVIWFGLCWELYIYLQLTFKVKFEYLHSLHKSLIYWPFLFYLGWNICSYAFEFSGSWSWSSNFYLYIAYSENLLS